MKLISAILLILITYRNQDTFTAIQAQEIHVGAYPLNLDLEYHADIQGFYLSTSPLKQEHLVLQIRLAPTGNYELYLFPDTYEMKDWQSNPIVFDSRNIP